MSVGELRAFGDWRGCLFCVCAWFGVNKRVVLLDCACCVYHKGSGSHVQRCPRPSSSTHIDEPGFQPTDTEGPHNAVKSVLSCPNVALLPPHVCHRRRTGLGGRHFFWRPHIWAHLSSYGLCINRNAKHKVQQLHVGKPRSRREIQRIFRALPGDLRAPMHD